MLILFIMNKKIENKNTAVDVGIESWSLVCMTSYFSIGLFYKVLDQTTDNKSPLKWAWLGHVNRLNFYGPQLYLWNG